MSFINVSLFMSLVFGVAQCVFGVAVLAHGLRANRWRRTGVFLLMVLGAWALCSGTAELLVSCLDVTARAGGVPGPAQLTAVQHTTDMVLIAVSGALLLPLAGFSLWKRLQARRSPTLDATTDKD